MGNTTIDKQTLREYVKQNEVMLKKGDRVTFRCGDEIKEGAVCIVDAHGTFEQPGVPSYDILVEEENMLYKHVSHEMIMLEDERGQLFLKYIDMIEAKQPKFFVIENVKGSAFQRLLGTSIYEKRTYAPLFTTFAKATKQ